MPSAEQRPSDAAPHLTAADRKLQWGIGIVGVTAGLLQARAHRFAIEPDGVNYLDIAQAYLRHDWDNAVNAYWSPLYSWMLGLVLRVGPSSLYWESTLLHLVNFLNYVVALGCFAFFLREWTALCAESSSSSNEEGLANWAWKMLGYGLCLYALLEHIGVGTDTPDLVVAAAFFAATGLLVKLRRGDRQASLYAMLGLVLGLGYLAKAVMFPLAFVFLFAALLGGRNIRGRWPRALLALAVFFAVSGPFVVAVSRAKGRFTFGDTGRLNYAYYVNGLSGLSHWHGEVAGAGTPVHGTRQLWDKPPVDEFGEPISGTYPPWFDPSYWLEGVRPHIAWRGQVRVLRDSAEEYFRILSAEKGVAVGLLILVLFAGSARGYARNLAKTWPVWLPALAMLGLYALVHVETRFLGAAVVILWCSLFGAVRLPRGENARRLAACVAVAVSVALAVTIAKGAAGDFSSLLRGTPHTQWEVAAGLRRMGVKPGERVAVVGHTNVADYWAHLARLRIVADTPLEEVPQFWAASAARRKEILGIFARTGARAVLTREIPGAANSEGWRRIGDSGYFIVMLRENDAEAGP